MPMNRLWNHSPNSGPKSISMRRSSSPSVMDETSTVASLTTTPAACATTLCAASNTPMTIVQVFVTMRIAHADLNIHLKKTAVSISWKLLRSVTICISSSVMTMARITPAMGRMTVSESVCIMLKMSPFQPCGVWPICPLICETFSLTLSNNPVRFEIIPPAKISFSQSVSAFLRNSMRPHLQPRAMRRGARICRSSAEQAREQRHKRHADERHAASRDQLLHALAARAGVVLTITFQQVYYAPDTETGSERNYKRLQHFDCRIEKLHPKTRGRAVNEHRPPAQPRPPSI